MKKTERIFESPHSSQTHNIKKLKWCDILVLVILVVSFLVRVSQIDYPFAFKLGDGERDYLVARHIVKYQEYPLVGPPSFVVGKYDIQNSPFYYDLLALMLVPYTTIFMLSIVNIFLQTGAIALVYVLGKSLFGKQQGIIAMLLFSTRPEIISQSQFVWQPYLSLPFLYASFYLLYLTYQKKNYWILLLGLVTFLLAGVIHNSIFAFFPIYFITVFFILKKQEYLRVHYLGVIVAVLSSLLLFYFPTFIYYTNHLFHIGPRFSIFSILAPSYSIFLSNISTNIKIAWLAWLTDVSYGKILPPLIIVSSFLYGFFLNEKKAKTHLLLLLLVAITELIVVVSILGPSYNQLQYLSLSYGLVAIFIGEVLYSFFSSRKWLVPAGWVLLLIFSSLIFQRSIHRLVEKNNFNQLKKVNFITARLRREIALLKKTNSYHDENFFTIHSYIQNHGIMQAYSILDSVFLVRLEEEFNKKLTILNKEKTGFTQLNTSDYSFVTCYDFDHYHNWLDCEQLFIAEHRNYQIVKRIYTGRPLSIYLAKKMSQFSDPATLTQEGSVPSSLSMVAKLQSTVILTSHGHENPSDREKALLTTTYTNHTDRVLSGVQIWLSLIGGDDFAVANTSTSKLNNTAMSKNPGYRIFNIPSVGSGETGKAEIFLMSENPGTFTANVELKTEGGQTIAEKSVTVTAK